MVRAALLLSLSAMTGLLGCRGIDPWGEFDRLPESRAEPFEASVGALVGEDAALAPGPRSGAGELAGRTLRLSECIDIALERTPRTAESWRAIRAAAARAGRARAGYLPVVGFTASAARGDAAELDDRTDSGTRNRYGGVFGLRWLVFDGGGREARVDAAVAEVLAAGFRHNTVLQDVALTTSEAYYHLLAARSLRRLAEETVRQRDHHLRLARGRHEAGVVSRSDVLRAETEKAAAELTLVEARSAVEVARGRLSTAMGLPVVVALEVEDLPESPDAWQRADIRALLEEASRNRPELAASLARVHAGEAAVRLAESRYRPALALDADLGRIGRDLLPDEREWGIGVALDLPLFTGFDRNYQLHAGKAGLEQSLAARRIVLQGVELQVWTAYWRALESAQAIAAAERLVASAEESARLAEGEYENGTGTIIGLIDAQTRRAAAHDRLIRVRLDRRAAMDRLEHAVGRSLTSRTAPPAPEESERN